MRIKQIIKRGVDNTDWLDGFVESRLKGEASHSAVCTDKMYYAISKYARGLEYHIDEYCTRVGLFFNNGIYALEVIEGYKGKNVLYIYDIDKCIDTVIEKRVIEFYDDHHKEIENNTLNQDELGEFKEFFIKDITVNFNPFRVNFVNNKTNRNLMHDREDFIYIISDYI